MWEPEPYVLDLSDVIQLSDDDLLKICAANPDLRIEQNAAGQLEIMPPAGASSSARHADVVWALKNWNMQKNEGIVFDSSGGFRLPNGAVRAPDAAWVRFDRWSALPPEDQEKFAPVVPDFFDGKCRAHALTFVRLIAGTWSACADRYKVSNSREESRNVHICPFNSGSASHPARTSCRRIRRN